jgi:uncharacterized membrane protein YesL
MGRKLVFVIMDWIWRLSWLNLLWILFSIPIITIIPSTFAMYAVTNRWQTDDVDIEILPTFYKAFKKYLVKSLPLGSILVGIGVFLYVDLLILKDQTEGILLILRYAILVIAIFYVPIALYSIPVYIQTNITWYKALPVAFIVAMKKPINTMMVLCGIVGVLCFVLFFTGFGVLFFGSLCALFTTKGVITGLKRI